MRRACVIDCRDRRQEFFRNKYKKGTENLVARIHFETEEEKKEYVHACDADFESRLDTVVKQICDLEGLRYLTLSGPTCSGKTTASEKLISEFAERGRKVKIISLDDFFRDRKELIAEAKDGKLDFDSDKALDLPELAAFMKKLQAGREVDVPRFDFNEGRRVGYERLIRDDAEIIIFEGIQAIYPCFTSLIDDKKHTAKVYITPLGCLHFGDRIISRREVRLWRRLVRDNRYRSAEPEFTFMLWETVIENEDKNILPYEEDSDFIIDSMLGYEPGMLKPALTQILSQINSASVYYDKSRSILATLEGVAEIDESYLPEISLYHEFI